MTQKILLCALLAAGFSCDRPTPPPGTQPSTAPAAQPETATSASFESITVSEFILRGEPTFILGTAGDDRADAAISSQVALLRSILPRSAVVDDSSIDASKGPSAWPQNPVLYGGPHVNSLLAAIAPGLPFTLGPGALSLGGETFTGDYFLITVVPARAADEKGPGYPEFVLYSGTGTPGIAEINSGAISTGLENLLISDAFGPLLLGRWERTASGEVRPDFSSPRRRRLVWRPVERQLSGSTQRVWFLEMLPPDPEEEAIVEACLRGLKTVVQKLKLASPSELSLYIHPDRRSKKSLTGRDGDGHAVAAMRALHVRRVDPSLGGGMESLIAHEGTHLLAYDAWGPTGSSLWGEGLAVWVSGQYGGTPLAAWKVSLTPRPSIKELMGPAFRKLPEKDGYPLAGKLVEVAIQEVGIEKVRAHFWGATADTWEAACKSAGTTPERLEEALSLALNN